MTSFLVATNLVMTLGFLVALVILLALPLRTGGFGKGGFKLVIGAALAIYVFVGVSRVLQFLNITAMFDVYENYLKVLFIPVVTIGTLAGYVDQQLKASQSQARVLAAEHDMLMRVLETTQTGIAVVDAAGHVEFANERGQAMLGLHETAATGRYSEPAWALTCSGSVEPTRDFSLYVSGETVRDAECTLRWPAGRSLRLIVNATPITAVDGSVSGAVVAFAER
jgi:PAS domain-containing protein